MKNCVREWMHFVLTALLVIVPGYPTLTLSQDPIAPNTLPEANLSNLINGQSVRNDFSDPAKATFTSDMTGASAILRQFIQNANVHFNSFNIGADASVTVIHPSQTASTVGHIHQSDPSKIFGVLNVTTEAGGNGGQVILLNQNGFMFGPNARIGSIDTTSATRQYPSGFIASSLDLNPLAEDGDILLPIQSDEAAFIPYATGASGAIRIEEGAQINTAEQGKVFLFAPEIINEGNINTPQGQTLLAAGNRVYLASDEDNIAGVIAEVEVGGTVTNGSDNNANLAPGVSPDELLGKIVADQGIVTLLGKTVNQNGLVSADSSIEIGGVVRLIARDGALINNGELRGASDGGQLTLGRNSVTQSNPDLSNTDERTDDVLQPQGFVQLYGEQIHLEEYSQILANSGNVELVSRNATTQSEGVPNIELENPAAGVAFNPNSNIQIDSNARIDVSGLDIVRTEEDLLLELDLRSGELADNPVSRDALNGSTVVVDATSDTNIADVSDFIDAIPRDIAERSLAGGTISIQGEGTFELAENAILDVSGGSTTYTIGGVAETPTYLVDVAGNIVPIDQATADQLYVGVLDPSTPIAGWLALFNMRASGVRTMSDMNNFSSEASRVEGRSAGLVNINARLPNLKGNLVASTEIGELQTELGLNRSLARVNNPQITSNFAPLGGSLIIGNTNNNISNPLQFRIENIRLTNGVGGIVGDASNLTEAIVEVPVSIFDPNQGNFSDVTLAANRQISIPASVSINGKRGDSLLMRSRQVIVDGDVRLPSGNFGIDIENASSNLGFAAVIGQTTTIDLSGIKLSVPFSSDIGVRALDGGNFTIDLKGQVPQGQQLTIADNANIDVSAGYAVSTQDGGIAVGQGGSVNLISSTNVAVGFNTDISLDSFSGFGVVVPSVGGSVVGRGGSLTIEVPNDICVSSSNCAGLSNTALQITPDLIADQGFSEYNFSSVVQGSLGAVSVAGNFDLRSKTRQVPLLDPLNPQIGEIADPSLVVPVSLSLGSVQELTLDQNARIIGQAGAEISLSAAQQLFIDGRIDAPAGRINIALGDGEPGLDQYVLFGDNARLDVSAEFIPQVNALGLNLGSVRDAGTISVTADSGFVVAKSGAQFNAFGLAASIDQLATNETLESVLSRVVLGASNNFDDVVDIGSAGALLVTAAEGILWDAGINLSSARPANSPNGMLAFALDPNSRGGTSQLPPARNDFNQDARIIRVTATDNSRVPLGFEFGDALPEQTLGGTTLISQEMIERSGAGSLSLASRDILFTFADDVGTQLTGVKSGEIQFDENVELVLNDFLELNTSILSIPSAVDADVNIRADIVQIGSFQGQESAVRTIPVPRSAVANTQLTINANHIDVIGDSAIADIATLYLNSSGDIRFVGTTKRDNGNLVGNSTSLTGSLNLSDVELILAGQQMYPATLTQFEINNRESVVVDVLMENGEPVLDALGRPIPVLDSITNQPDIVFDFLGNGLPILIDDGRTAQIQTIANNSNTPASPVLAAGGSLTFNSTNFVHGGVIRSPLGSVAINAQLDINIDNGVGGLELLSTGNLQASSGSIISTNAQGELIPFGRIQLNQDLVYEFGPNINQNAIFGAEDSDLPLPESSISLLAENIDLAASSILDVSAGGDLFSYEYIPGVSGTVDFLSPGNAGESFAIIPSTDFKVAPFDLQNSRGFEVALGESVELDGAMFGLTGGLQKFVKLPAIYALLPGAYLVTPEAGTEGLRVGETLTQFDGSVLAGGRSALSNSGVTPNNIVLDTFRIESQSVLARRGQYDTVGVSEFARQNPNVGGDFRLAQDAGVVTLQANQTLNIDGTLLGNTSTGLGAELRIASEQIAIVNENSTLSIFDGFLTVEDSQLNSFGASTLLLGAVDTELVNGLSENVITETLLVDENSSLQVSELILAAKSNLLIDDNVSIVASSASSGGSNNEFQLNQDGAVFIASGDNRWSVNVVDSLDEPTAMLAVGRGASNTSVSADESIVLFAENLAYDLGEVSSQGAFLIETDVINFGQVPASQTGTNITDAQLNLISVNTLDLTAGQMNFFGAAEINAVNLSLSTSVLQADADNIGSNVNVDLNVESNLSLSGIDNRRIPPVNGNGVFNATAASIILGENDLAFSNFADVNLTGSGAISVQGDGSLGSASELNIISSAVEAGSGFSYLLSTVQGNINFSNPGEVSSSSSTAIGGQLTVLASNNITVDTRVSARSGSVNLTSVAGSVAVEDQGYIDVSGLDVRLGNELLSTPGGILNISAQTGLTVANGSTIDVRGGSASQSGAVDIFIGSDQLEFAGNLLGGASQRSLTGGFSINLQSLDDDDFANLNAALNAAEFSGGRTIRVREDSLSLGENDSILSERVRLVADNGSITIAGLIDASSTEGGSVELYAQNDVDLAETSFIDARSLTDSEFIQSEVLLSSNAGMVNLMTGAQIDLRKQAIDSNGQMTEFPQGELYIRTSRDGDTGVNIGDFAATILGGQRVVVEAVDQTASVRSIDTALQNTLLAQTNAFGNNIDAIELGLSADLTAVGNAIGVEVLPGIELFNVDSLAIDDSWDLSTWRFGSNNRPGVLTIRSAGNIAVNESLSDGVIREANRERVLAGDSWSMRLVAGADASSASPIQTIQLLPGALAQGSITLAAGTAPGVTSLPFPIITSFGEPTVIRTGNGDIDIHAAGDLEFGNQYANIYTAGVPAVGRVNPDGSIDDAVLLPGLDQRLYSDQAGDLTVSVGGSISGIEADRYVNDFLFKTGNRQTIDLTTGQLITDAVGWAVDTVFFNHELGVIGGGKLSIFAGGDITNIGVALPSIGMQVGGASITESDVHVIGGGLLDVDAGGDLIGNSFVIGRGSADINTFGSFGDSTAAGDSIAGGEGTIRVTARNDITVGHLYSPTITPRSLFQSSLGIFNIFGTDTDSGFSSFEQNSKVSLTSLSGDIAINGTLESFIEEFGLQEEFGGQAGDADRSRLNLGLLVNPSTLETVALNGSIGLEGSFILAPSVNSSLRILAKNNVALGSDLTPANILLPDIDPVIFPTYENPANQDDWSPLTPQPFDTVFNQVVRSVDDNSIDFNRYSDEPLRSRIVNGSSLDNEISTIVADSGSVNFLSFSGVEIAEPLAIFAGDDLFNPTFIAQNLRSEDVTQIIVGDQLIQESIVLPNGQINPVVTGIVVDGPGRVDLQTGGNVNFGTSQGLISRGNLVNRNLSADGADINILTGIAPTSLDSRISSFVSEYILNADAYDTEVNNLLSSLGQRFVQTLDQLGETIVDPQSIVEFAALSDSSKLNPLLNLSAADLQTLYLIGSGTDISTPQQKAVFTNLNTSEQYQVVQSAFFGEVFAGGNAAGEALNSGRGLTGFYQEYERTFDAVRQFFPEHADTLALLSSEVGSLLASNPDALGGDIVDLVNSLQARNPDLFINSNVNFSSFFSGVFSRDGGDFNIINPFGLINAGISTPPGNVGLDKGPAELGFIVEGGAANIFVGGDLLINESRLVGVGASPLQAVSLFDNLDAGRGSVTAAAASSPVISIDNAGNRTIVFAETFAGSGIRTRPDRLGRTGTISLFTPFGEVVAGDAGISSANSLSISALDVVGTNIDAGGDVSVSSGSAVAAPQVTTSVDPSASATRSAEDSAGGDDEEDSEKNSFSRQAATFLNVLVLGVGDGSSPANEEEEDEVDENEA